MTPKEKASGLFMGYKNLFTFSISDHEMLKKASIECSLILVDEIINTDSLISNEEMETTAHLSYWEDVKRELANL